MNKCNKCESYKKEVEKYKNKYEIAKSGLSIEERTILLGLIENEQIKHMIANDKYDTNEYIMMEHLKAKLRIM